MLAAGGLRGLAPCLRPAWPLLREWPGRLGGGRGGELPLKEAETRLRGLEDLLATGQSPTLADWQGLATLGVPWGGLCGEGLAELRARGAPLLPSLKRLRALAAAQRETLLDGRARTATAFAQAWACIVLVPGVACFLAHALPALATRAFLWWAVTIGATLLSACGATWIARLAETARWGGLAPGRRNWALEAPVAGERVLALLRAGEPPDLAWARALADLGTRAPELVVLWGAGLFLEGMPSHMLPRASEAEAAFARLGLSMKRALQNGALAGRAASEHLEAALDALRVEFSARVQREVGLLGTRALTPLFAFCAPAVIGLFALALYLSWASAWEGGW